MPRHNAAEPFKGTYRSKNVEENLKKVREILSRLDLLEFNVTASDIYGQITSELEKGGEHIGDTDVLIASIALAHNGKNTHGKRQALQQNKRAWRSKLGEFKCSLSAPYLVK